MGNSPVRCFNFLILSGTCKYEGKGLSFMREKQCFRSVIIESLGSISRSETSSKKNKTFNKEPDLDPNHSSATYNQCFGSGSGAGSMWIRIETSPLDPDPDPGQSKWCPKRGKSL